MIVSRQCLFLSLFPSHWALIYSLLVSQITLEVCTILLPCFGKREKKIKKQSDKCVYSKVFKVHQQIDGYNLIYPYIHGASIHPSIFYSWGNIHPSVSMVHSVIHLYPRDIMCGSMDSLTGSISQSYTHPKAIAYFQTSFSHVEHCAQASYTCS